MCTRSLMTIGFAAAVALLWMPVPAHSAPAPFLQADPSGIELGYVQPQTQKDVTFALVNTAATPVKIARIRANCECVKVVKWPTTMAAGARESVQLEFAAPTTPVLYDRTLTIYCDDAQQPKLVVPIRARVGLPLAATSQPVELGSLVAGEVRQGTVVIHNDGTQPVGLAYAISSEPSLVARVPRQPIPAQGTLAVPLEVKAVAAAGEHKATVTFQTNSTTQPALPVAVRYAVDGGYAVSPGTIELGTLRPGQEGKATIRLTRQMARGEPLIETVDAADIKGIQCQATLRNEPGVGVVECTFTAGGQSGPIQGQLSIHLKDRPQAVGVPVRGVVQDPTSQPASSPATAPAER